MRHACGVVGLPPYLRSHTFLREYLEQQGMGNAAVNDAVCFTIRRAAGAGRRTT